MTYFPDYLKSFPNMEHSLLHISLHTLTNGFRAHRHDFLEFSYVVEGNGYEIINGEQHLMTPGTFTFVQPYQIHEIITHPGNTLVLYNCNFAMELLADQHQNANMLTLLDQADVKSYIYLKGKQHEHMHALMQSMLSEYEQQSKWRLAMLRAKLKEVLITFDRLLAINGGNSGISNVTAASQIQAARKTSSWPIIYYIHQHYQEELTLSCLAKRFSMSISRISEVIKETTGQSFVHFLHDLRIRQACSLLVSTEMSVAEIAMEVGYGSYQTFARVFREAKGVVPKNYRKQS